MSTCLSAIYGEGKYGLNKYGSLNHCQELTGVSAIVQVGVLTLHISEGVDTNGTSAQVSVSKPKVNVLERIFKGVSAKVELNEVSTDGTTAINDWGDISAQVSVNAVRVLNKNVSPNVFARVEVNKVQPRVNELILSENLELRVKLNKVETRVSKIIGSVSANVSLRRPRLILDEKVPSLLLQTKVNNVEVDVLENVETTNSVSAVIELSDDVKVTGGIYDFESNKQNYSRQRVIYAARVHNSSDRKTLIDED